MLSKFHASLTCVGVGVDTPFPADVVVTGLEVVVEGLLDPVPTHTYTPVMK